MPKARNYDDEIGMKYSRLTVKGWYRKDSVVFYNCICDCGGYKEIRRSHVVNKLIESCGCLRSEILTKRNTKHSGTKDQIYNIWRGILRRARGKVDNVQPNYKGTTISEDWLTNYLSFKEWFQSQADNYQEQQNFNLEVDKDILIEGNKHYSKETCLVVPDFVNRFLTSRHNYRGKYVLGVSREENKIKFKATISICGKQVCLGYFRTEEEAHRAWISAKIVELIRIQSTLPNEVAQSLNRILCKLQNALINNKIIDKL